MAEESNGYVDAYMINDIRKYVCKYCGITRSKKYLITSHILSHHKIEIEEEIDIEASEVTSEEFSSKHTCEECDAEFKKPAHLKQHMQSHSLERPFTCYVDDCGASYRRKDHLNRHLLTHKGKLFKCRVENCKSEFSVQGNVGRHVKLFHNNGDGVNENGQALEKENDQKQQHVCKEIGCGKAFKYLSNLKKHQDSHVKLDAIEAFCLEPGCMKYFTNDSCLKAHIRSCHQHVNCEICGSKHLKKNIKRHLRTHEDNDNDTSSSSSGVFKCDFEGCSSTFSKVSNLEKHVKAVHEDIRPFICGFQGCGMRFGYKHVRNKHEKSRCHVYTCGDFIETDEDFTSRPRGGLKRKQVTAEMLFYQEESKCNASSL